VLRGQSGHEVGHVAEPFALLRAKARRQRRLGRRALHRKRNFGLGIPQLVAPHKPLQQIAARQRRAAEQEVWRVAHPQRMRHSLHLRRFAGRGEKRRGNWVRQHVDLEIAEIGAALHQRLAHVERVVLRAIRHLGQRVRLVANLPPNIRTCTSPPPAMRQRVQSICGGIQAGRKLGKKGFHAQGDCSGHVSSFSDGFRRKTNKN